MLEATKTDQSNDQVPEQLNLQSYSYNDASQDHADLYDPEDPHAAEDHTLESIKFDVEYDDKVGKIDEETEEKSSSWERVDEKESDGMDYKNMAIYMVMVIAILFIGGLVLITLGYKVQSTNKVKENVDRKETIKLPETIKLTEKTDLNDVNIKTDTEVYDSMKANKNELEAIETDLKEIETNLKSEEKMLKAQANEEHKKGEKEGKFQKFCKAFFIIFSAITFILGAYESIRYAIHWSAPEATSNPRVNYLLSNPKIQLPNVVIWVYTGFTIITAGIFIVYIVTFGCPKKCVQVLHMVVHILLSIGIPAIRHIEGKYWVSDVHKVAAIPGICMLMLYFLFIITGLWVMIAECSNTN